MKLISRIMLNMVLILAVGLSVWALVFYYSLKSRIIRETDSALTQVSEQIMQRYLSGQDHRQEGSNNLYTFNLIPIPEQYAQVHKNLSFSEGEKVIQGKRGKQAVRTLHTIFRTQDNQHIALQVSTPISAVHNLRITLLWGIAIL